MLACLLTTSILLNMAATLFKREKDVFIINWNVQIDKDSFDNVHLDKDVRRKRGKKLCLDAAC